MTSTILSHLPGLPLTRLGDDAGAGLCIASLPWPRAAASDLSMGGRATFAQPLGLWPGEPEGTPRRVLLFADGGNDAPAQLALAEGAAASTAPVSFGAEMEVFERSPHASYIWERSLLRLRHGEKNIGLAMGLRTGDEVHWWEACRLVITEETPECIVLEMGGAIPLSVMQIEDFKKYPGLTNPYLHKHNWLNGHIFARLHANGVCEIYAHHINSKFFDDGLDLKDAVPVIGIRTEGGFEELCGPWDGMQRDLAVGDARFDLTEVARLATLQQPGSLTAADGFLVLQPYEGMELFGGDCPNQLTGDPFIVRSTDKTILRGMARTLRFSLSLSDRSPRVARYLAPAWWYGACEEFQAAPLVPVSNEYDVATAQASQWVTEHIVTGGFEDGSLPRHSNPAPNGMVPARHEPGWEGELPYGEFLRAWRTGNAAEYSAAMRAAYYVTDVSVDHAAKAFRMHGNPPNAFAVPMNRAQASIAAYLETGDGYLLETAQAVTATSYWTHKNSWPRLGVGRDASFVRSAVLLYRYFGDEFFRKMALDGARTAVATQRPNGSFGDQGGGAGIHQWGAYITKPWMGLLALGGALDYLELFSNDPALDDLVQSVHRFADWLMAERFDHNGIMGWSYQHDFDGARVFYNPITAEAQRLPGKDTWHHDNLGRLLLWCSLRFDDPQYFDAWAESRVGAWDKLDHAASATLQFVPWVQDRLWNAQLADTAEGFTAAPVDFGSRTPKAGRIMGPKSESFAASN